MADASSEFIESTIMDRVTHPEVQAAIKQLDVDPNNSRFMKLVDDMLRPESLPRGWSSDFIAAENRWVYKDKQGRLHDHHPVHDYYIGAMFMDRGGYERLKKIAVERPPTSEEVKAMGLYLHIKEGDDPYLWQVAEMALCAPMPQDWEEIVEGTPEAPCVTFRNKSSGFTSEEHPLDNYFRELLRRRRLQVMRKKLAALKALQALVRMGGARRNLLSTILAQKKKDETAAANSEAASEHEFDDDVDAMPAAAQASLITAWRGLLGSAAHMINCMQAAQGNAAASNHTLSAPGAAAEASAADEAVQDRLQLLSDELSAALEPDGTAAASDSSSNAAAAVLQCIKQLASRAAAAGTDTDKLAEVLVDQDIMASALGKLSDTISNSNSQSNNQNTEHTMQGGCQDHAAADDAVDTSTTAVDSSSGSNQGTDLQISQLSLRRPSIDHSQQAPAAATLTRRQSLLADQVIQKQVEFVQIRNPTSVMDSQQKVDTFPPRSSSAAVTSAMCSSSGVYANFGPYSSTGGSQVEPWSLSGAAPTAAGLVAAQQARANAAAGHSSSTTADVAEGVHSQGNLANIELAKGGFDALEGKGQTAYGARGSEAIQQAQEHVVRLLQGRASIGDVQQGIDGDKNSAESKHLQTRDMAQALDVQSPLCQQQQQQESTGNLAPNLMMCLQDVPATAEAALRHMTALQAVVTEATSVIQSWQQQRLLILLLQQRLAAANAQAQASQGNLHDAVNQIEHLKQQQQQHAAAAAGASQCEGLRQQQQIAHQQLNSLQQASNLQQMQQQSGNQELQQFLEAAVAAAAAQQQQLQTQLQTVQEELQDEQQKRQQEQEQRQQTQAELEKLMAEHLKLREYSGVEAAAVAAQYAQLLLDHQQLQDQQAKLTELLAQEQGMTAETNMQKQQIDQQLQQSRQENQQLQEAYHQLQLLHDQQVRCNEELQQSYAEVQHAFKQQGADLSCCRDMVRQLQQQLEGKCNDGNKLQQDMTTLQGGYDAAMQKQQQLIDQKASQDIEMSRVLAELANVQQQLAQTQQSLQQAEQQIHQLQSQNEKALEDQIQIMNMNSSLIKEINNLKAAAEAAEKLRLSKPSKVAQITASDADQQHWTRSRSVQTGEDIDPRSRRDVGTPADLALLSYFFRDVKHKLRGGGGAVIGYDPENAREAAAVAASHDHQVHKGDKSPSGGALPGLGAEARRAATSPGGMARPHTSTAGAMTHRRNTPEEEPKEGNLNLRPISWEVKQRVDRRRDREIKLRHELPVGAAAAGGHDRWDYGHDERDNEIAELKKRLIEADKKSKEAAAKAADELRDAVLELQNTKNMSEQLQSQNFTLRKEIDSLRLAVQTAGMTAPDLPEAMAGAARSSLIARTSIAAARSSIMSAPTVGQAIVFDKASSTAPRSSTFYGRPQTVGVRQSRRFSSAGGGAVSVGSSAIGGNNMLGARSSMWGSGFGGLAISNPGVLAGGVSVIRSGSGDAQVFTTGSQGSSDGQQHQQQQQHGAVCMLSLSGGSGRSPGQQLVPTIRSASAALD